MEGSRGYTLELCVKSSASMWGGCTRECAYRGREQGSWHTQGGGLSGMPPTAVSYLGLPIPRLLWWLQVLSTEVLGWLWVGAHMMSTQLWGEQLLVLLGRPRGQISCFQGPAHSGPTCPRPAHSQLSRKLARAQDN